MGSSHAMLYAATCCVFVFTPVSSVNLMYQTALIFDTQ